MNYVSYDEFKKMDMRLGLIKFVEPVEGTDKLLRFEIDFGELPLLCTGECTPLDCSHEDKSSCDCEANCTCVVSDELPFGKQEYQGRDIRQIVSGVREFFPKYETLIGRYGLYILNLEPREIRGVMSYGMLMAVDGVNGAPVFLGPQGDVEPGSSVR